MTDPERFTGLIEHLERYAGPLTGAEPTDVDGGNRGFDIAFYDDDENDLTTTITNGLRFQDLPADLPQELVCTVDREQTEAARHLLDHTGRLAIAHRRALEWGSILRNQTAVLVDTEIYGLVAGPHPFFAEDFDVLIDAGEPVLRLITLIPATRPELDYAEQRDVQDLYAVWSEKQTALSDVTRASAL